MLRESLIRNLCFLKKTSYVENKIYKQFLSFVSESHDLIRDRNIKNHLCCFFLPVHHKSNSVYLVHHKKAMDWIPPGGHIDRYELPVDTIKREFHEELSYMLTTEKVTLADISIKRIDKKTHPCKTHYDLWYTVECREKTPFIYLEDEFLDAGWFSLQKALSKMKYIMYRKIVRKIAAGFTDANQSSHAV